MGHNALVTVFFVPNTAGGVEYGRVNSHGSALRGPGFEHRHEGASDQADAPRQPIGQSSQASLPSASAGKASLLIDQANLESVHGRLFEYGEEFADFVEPSQGHDHEGLEEERLGIGHRAASGRGLCGLG